MGDVVHLFARMRSDVTHVSPAPLVSDGVAPDPAPSSRPQSDADRAQAAMFAQLLSEHRSRIALALDDVDPADPDQARLDRAALRKELREVSAVLDTIDRRTT